MRRACKADEQLYQELIETLDWERRTGSFIQQPLRVRSAKPFQPSQIVADRFEILQEIGEGGMGIVYEAFDQKRNQRIAIKSAKPGFQRLLSPELEGALKVRHHNICLVNEIHTAQTTGGEIDFLTMELLQGQTLSAYLSEYGPLGRAEALEIARQLCAGLAEAHRSGILHRDLKTGNIILCRNDDNSLRVVITDFGLARPVAFPSNDTGGTPAYMAPELWQGAASSKASDIYALGVILSEMIKGQRPSSGQPVGRSSAAPPDTPAKPDEKFGRAWERIMSACLDPLPENRPVCVTDVLTALEKRSLRESPVFAMLLLALAFIAVVGLVSPLRRRAIELVRPPNIRLALLPLAGAEQAQPLQTGMVQDIVDRVRQLRTGDHTIVVIPPTEASKNGIRSPIQAKQLLHASHALLVSIERHGNVLAAQAAVIDLDTQVHLRDFSAHYSASTVGALPAAITGAVSIALRLKRPSMPESLSPSATVPYAKGLFFLRASGQRFGEAVPLFEQAAALDPRSPLPLAELAEAQIMKFKATKDHQCLTDARRFLNQAEGLNPDSIRVRLSAGLLNETTGQYERALNDYRRVQELEPGNIDALLRIASVYNAIDMADEAVRAYQQVIQLDPGLL